MVPAFFSKAMILFNCDYSEGAHADILRRMAETNMEQTAGYGEDPYCDQARKLIAGLCGRTDLDIHFLIGGTQTNFTVIAAALRPHQCVLCADTGHINVHESGAFCHNRNLYPIVHRAISMCTSREPLKLADTRFPPFLPRTGS